MKKINELTTKRMEEAQRKKEELDAKQREVEENKRKLNEEKKRDELEKQRAKETQRLHTTNTNTTTYSTTSTTSSVSNNITNTATSNLTACKPHQTPQHVAKPYHHTYANKMANSENTATTAIHAVNPPKSIHISNYDVLTSFKSAQNPQNAIGKPAPLQSIGNQGVASKPLESISVPLKPPAPAALAYVRDNYDINDLKSEDETDDEEEPSKPIPEWAKDARLKTCAQAQARKLINYTRLFYASSQNEIILENIFKIKRKKFTERSSSAIWNSPPVWKTSGLNGNESFRLMHK